MRRTSGAMRERLGFEKRTETTGDGAGNFRTDWAEQFEARAEIVFVKGREDVHAARVEGKQPVVFRIHNSASARAMDQTWRIVSKNNAKTYNIGVWNFTHDDKFIEVYATGGGVDG